METKRIEFRNQGNGWSSVVIKTGYGEDRKIVESFKVRTNADALVNLSKKMKDEGYQGVNWGACSAKYWVGETF